MDVLLYETFSASMGLYANAVAILPESHVPINVHCPAKMP
jgi:hypothetical protein